MTSPIAETLDEATPALIPEKPLESDDDRFQDFTAGRGTRATRRIFQLLKRNPPDQFIRLVFTSHRGAGKSTEIKRLAHDLSQKYLCLYLEANVEMNAVSIEVEDLFLALVRLVEETMRKEGLPLDEKLLGNIYQWFTETIKTTSAGKTYRTEIKTRAEAKASIPLLANLMARLSALFRAESSHKTEVKETLKKFPGSLLDSVNLLLDEANTRLKRSGRQLLIMIDNLDRYEPAVIDQMLTANAERFRKLHCNLLLTPPISLIYQPESEILEQNYNCFSMPTVKLREQGDDYKRFNGVGRDLLVKALARRINLDRLIPNEAARDRLVFGSGGSIRNLLELTLDATLEAEQESISLDDVNRVLQRRLQRYRDLINANGLMSALVQMSLNKQLDAESNCGKALYHRLAFMYNGEGWYDVHPLITELGEFQRARQAAEASQASESEQGEPEDGAS